MAITGITIFRIADGKLLEGWSNPDMLGMQQQLGLVGLYARQVERKGRLGLVGFVLVFAGTALVGSILLVAATRIPLIAAEAQSIFEQATALSDFLVPVFVLGFGLVWIGYTLWSEKREPEKSGESSTRVSAS